MTTAEGAPTRRSGALRTFGVHLAALAVVLTAGFVMVEPSSSFSADEGAVIAQTRLLRDGSWTASHPLPTVDPDGRWFPLEHPRRTDDGFAPYAKHPVYPASLVPFDAVGGVPGMVALSVVGTWCASLVGALIAGRLDARAAIPTLWVLGVGSPLLFNGYLVIAHTIAAALCGVAALSIVRLVQDGGGGRVRIVVACTALALAIMLRSEAVLFAGGLVVGVVIGASVGLRRRVVLGGSLGAAGLVAYVVDGRLNQWVLGSQGVDPFTIQHADGFLEGRIDGFLISWIRPSLGAALGVDEALLVVLVVTALGLGVALRRHAEADLIRALALMLAVLALVRLVVEPSTVVPGLLPAFPLLAVALPILVPAERGASAVLVVSSAAFALAVLATQYDSAGSSQWGGRYFALALPAVVPVAVAAVVAHLADRDLQVRHALVGSAVVVMGSLAVTSVLGMREIHQGTAALTDRIALAAIGEAGADPVVVATRPATPRLAHDLLDDARWLLVPPEELDLALRRLAAAGERDVALVGPFDHLDRATDLAGYELVAETPGPSPTSTGVRRYVMTNG